MPKFCPWTNHHFLHASPQAEVPVFSQLMSWVCLYLCLCILFVDFSCFLKLSLLFRSGEEGKKLRWNHNMFSFSCNKQIFFSQASAGTKYQIWLETINYNVLQRMQSWDKKKYKCLQHVLGDIIAVWHFVVNSTLSHHFYLLKIIMILFVLVLLTFSLPKALQVWICIIISVFQIDLL